MKSLLLRMLVVSSLAVTALVTTAGPVFADDATCRNGGSGNNFFAGQHASNYQRRINRVVAHIDLPSQSGAFSICEPSGIDLTNNGPSVWVGVQAGTGTCPAPGNCILQVGIIKCAEFGVAACDGDAAPPSFFWAYGGCNGYQPIAKDLGPADFNDHQYMVAEGSDFWYLYIDLVSRAKIAKTDPGISCWVGGNPIVDWEGEKLDTADSFGTGSNVVNVTRMQYRYADTTNYTSYQAGNGDCVDISDYRDRCNFPVSGAYNMKIWTSQGGF